MYERSGWWMYTIKRDIRKITSDQRLINLISKQQVHWALLQCGSMLKGCLQQAEGAISMSGSQNNMDYPKSRGDQW